MKYKRKKKGTVRWKRSKTKKMEERGRPKVRREAKGFLKGMGCEEDGIRKEREGI